MFLASVVSALSNLALLSAWSFIQSAVHDIESRSNYQANLQKSDLMYTYMLAPSKTPMCLRV